MILRRITLEHYGCFGTAEFEFRRGMNLLSGGNDSGKSLLLAAIPAVLLGAAHGTRLRSWGNSLSCRAALHFEGGGCAVRLFRDLESNVVRIEESCGDDRWQESFSATVPVAGNSPERLAYLEQLGRIFSVGEPSLLLALVAAARMDAVLDRDGRLLDGLTAGASSPGALVVAPVDQEDAGRVAEIATLEAAIAADREEFLKGEEYLAWIRNRWASRQAPPTARKVTGGGEMSGPERERADLAGELARQGIPSRLPADLPALFEKAESLRQELATHQQEATPLQRRRQNVAFPSVLWPLLISVIALTPAGAGFWLQAPWMIIAAAGGGSLTLACWIIYLVRLGRAKAVCRDLDQELELVEARRAEALSRQQELAERFESFGLPSAPVEMVKLQQACRRNQELVDRYLQLCSELGDPSDAGSAVSSEPDDRHLRPEDLPDAEKRLREMAESLRQREAHLAALKSGQSMDSTASAGVADSGRHVNEAELLKSAGQLLDRLTGGRYREMRIEDGRLQIEAAPGRWASPSSLSRGTAETLVLALRLALCQTYKVALPMPVDDLPVNLDPHRRQVALRALERFAVDHQLLLATCDEELVKRGHRERWQIVDLDQPSQLVPSVEEETGHAGQLHLL